MAGPAGLVEPSEPTRTASARCARPRAPGRGGGLPGGAGRPWPRRDGSKLAMRRMGGWLGRRRAAAHGRMAQQTRWLALIAGLGIAILATTFALTAVLVVLPAERQARQADRSVDHTNAVIQAINGILQSADEAETGQRGFLMTQDPSYLEPYDTGIRAIWVGFADAQALIADNPNQLSRLDRLHGEIDSKLTELARTIGLARTGSFPAALEAVRTGGGKAMMDAIRRTTRDMIAEEDRLLHVREAERARLQRNADRTAILLLTVTGLGILACAGALVLMIRAMAARKRSATIAGERLRLLTVLNFAPIMIRDTSDTIEFWSDGCQRLYGYTAEQAVGRSAHELLQTILPAAPDEIDAALLRTGEWNGEVRNRTQSGAEVAVLVHSSLETNRDDGGLSVVETITNVTELRRMTADLAGSLAQFQAIVDAAADAIVIAHADGRIDTVNRATLRVFGYDDARELIGRDLAVLMPASEAERHSGYIANHQEGKPPRVIGIPGRQLTALRRDGTQFPIELSVSSFAASGRRYLTGIVRDATDRVESERALRASEARLSLFIEFVPAAIAVFDTDMCYLAMSRRYLTDRQFDENSRDRLIGRSHYEIFPEVSDRWRVIHRGVLAGERASSAAEPFLRADGRVNWVSWEMVPWRQADGSIGGAMLFSEDITERRAAEAALRDSESRLRLVQQIGGVVFTDRTLPDPDAVVSDGFAGIYGLPPGMQHVPVTEILARVHPDDRDRVTAVIQQTLDSTGTIATEFRICRPDGVVRWIGLRSEAFPGPTGLVQRIVSAQQDITEIVTAREILLARQVELERMARHLRKARDLAEQANRAKSRFLSSMSHELRTPLNGIIGYAHLLHMEGDLNAQQGNRVDAMLEAGRHLLEMIDCVLDMSEIEAEHVAVRSVEVDPRLTVAACLDLVRPLADAKRLALRVAPTPGAPPTVATDPTRLRQVLLNLLGNAVKFTAHGSVEVRLGQSADGSALRVEVVDTGSGIPSEQRQRLFQDFDRLDIEATAGVEGSGLGLATSRRLATLMGGSLGYRDNPAGGSVFWLELPLDPSEPSASDVAPAAGPSQIPAASPRPPLRALVVDDVLMNRDIAASFLRAAGHEVTCAEGGAEAVATVASRDLDVVLMDVRMPGMDGLEATRRIRALAGPRGQVPIMAVTAQAFTDQIADCRKAGMDSHLAKPFDPDTLLAAVVQAVDAGPRRVVESRPDATSDGPAAPTPGGLTPGGLAPTAPTPGGLTPAGPHRAAQAGCPGRAGPGRAGPHRVAPRHAEPHRAAPGGAPGGLAPTAPTPAAPTPTGLAPTGLAPTGLSPAAPTPTGVTGPTTPVAATPPALVAQLSITPSPAEPPGPTSPGSVGPAHTALAQDASTPAEPTTPAKPTVRRFP